MNESSTEPTVADSDAAVIRVNESGDGISDSREGPDNETPNNLHDEVNSTDPLATDTDANQLDDTYEINITLTEPMTRIVTPET